MSKFVIHVGYPKTATTSLQRTWFTHLREYGYYYAALTGSVDDVPQNPARQFVEYCRNHKTKPVSEIGSQERVVVSAEGIITDCIRQRDASGAFTYMPFLNVAGQCVSAARDHGATNPKMIVALRNQTDLMHSIYAQAYMHWFKRWGSLNTFGRYVDYVLSNKIYAQVYEYDKVVKTFFDAFGSANVLVVFYEDLCIQPEFFRRALESMLEVEFPRHMETLNARVAGDGARFSQTLSAASWLKNMKRRMLPGQSFGLGWSLNWLEQVTMTGAELIPSPEPWRLTIQGRFEDSNRRLASLLGRDLSALGYCQQVE